VPIWSTQYFPSQNGPWHLLTIQMLHEYDNPAFNYREYYVPSIHAIPHLAHTLLVYVLAFVFPLLTAHKIAISIYVLLLPVSVFWLLATVNRNRMAHGYVSFLLIYNVPLLRGYHDYVLGIPLVILTFTFWLRSRDRMTPLRIALLMVLIVFVYLSHVFNWLILGLAITVYAVHVSRSLRPLWHIVPLFAPATLLLAEFAWFSFHHTQWLKPSELVFVLPHSNAESFFRKFFFTMSDTAYKLTIVALLLGAPFVMQTIVKSYRKAGRVWYRAIVATPALTLFILLAALYFVTPFKLFGWHYVNVRFVPFVIIFGLASLQVAGQTAKRVAVAGVAVAAVSVYAILTFHFVQTGRQLDQYLSAMDKVERNAVVLPLPLEGHQIGSISPIARAYEYYPIFRGGANGQGLAKFNTVTPMVYRTYPVKLRFPKWNRKTTSDMRQIADTYDYVLVWGTGLYATLQLRDASFELVHEQGKLRLFRNGRKPVEQAVR
jgi:hypothetical protein